MKRERNIRRGSAEVLKNIERTISKDAPQTLTSVPKLAAIMAQLMPVAGHLFFNRWRVNGHLKNADPTFTQPGNVWA